jgi:DNA-binding GntR family transcriptional regulator
MNTLPYQEAFERIRAEFQEMPGMRLTAEQLERLSGVDRAVCQCVLDDLVRAKFLDRLPNGSYGRLSDTSKSESRVLHDEWQLAAGTRTRRAS